MFNAQDTAAKRRVKVLALTAIRSEYDLLYPLMRGLQAEPDFEVGFIVAGAHLTALHDHSVRLIEADGFPIVAKIENFQFIESGNTVKSRVKSAARLLDGLSDALTSANPNFLVYLGDREEPLMAAVACNYLGIPSIHIAGGDNAHPVGGDVDEEARHATTKLSHVHLTMTEAHTTRILQMGEEPWRIKTVGNPGLDRLRTEPEVTSEDMMTALGPEANGKYIVLVYHAVSSAVGQAPDELRTAMEECIATGHYVFIGAPNNDPGYADLMRITESFREHERVHIYKNLPRSIFATMLKRAQAIVGNSSLGLLEAGFIGVPAINVGERQRDRLAGINVQFVDGNSVDIRSALQTALFDTAYRENVRRAECIYGDGFMVDRSIQFIKSLPDRNSLLAKRISY